MLPTQTEPELETTMTQKSLPLTLITPLAFFLLATVAAAQTEQRDPLTGQITVVAAEEPEKPSKADLTEANQLVLAKDYSGAESVLAALQADFPEDADLLMLRGELLLALKRPEESIEVLRTAAELDPDRPRLHFQLASALVATGQTEPAIEAFGREIELSKDAQVLVFSHLNRSMLFQERKDWTASASELEAVLALDPERKPVYGDLVAMYVQSDRLDAAADTLERGEAVGFDSVTHWYSVAVRLAKDGEYERAVDLFTKAIALDPNHADSERALAAALEQLGQHDEAIVHLKRYLELNPEGPDSKAIRAKIDASEAG